MLIRRRDALKLGLGAGAVAAVAATLPFGGVGAGTFDQLHVLSIHRRQPRPVVRTSSLDALTCGYDYASFDDKSMSASQPIKVSRGDRVRFRFANTSILLGVTLGLPRHCFVVVALDGHAVPTPRCVERIYLGPAESLDALVTMDQPGRWILGASHREDRLAGLGRLVEYAGATGRPVAGEYGIAEWDYAGFGQLGAASPAASSGHAVSLPSLQIVRRLGMTDSQVYDPAPRAVPLEVSAGRHYRVAATNFTREPQSLLLLDHQVELVRVAGRQTAGVRKRAVTLPSFTRVEFEFDARANRVYLAHSPQVSLEMKLA